MNARINDILQIYPGIFGGESPEYHSIVYRLALAITNW